MKIRVDKYMWCVRLAKTRSQATELISKGKVKLNGMEIKPSREIKTGDVIAVQKHNAFFEYEVLDFLDKRVGPKLVENYLRDITKPEEIEKLKAYQLAQSSYREYGTGKPSKKDRRDLDDFLDF
ncbi:MAG: RNA-binding S4 domain-containing protein [Bacteroidota bacterium]